MSFEKLTLKAFVICIAALGCWWLFTFTASRDFPAVDLLQYWSATNVLVQGGDPYSASALDALQAPLALSDFTIRMWNPPWIFPLIIWMAGFEFIALRPVWLALSVVVTGLCLVMLVNNAQSLRERLVTYAFLLSCYPIPLMLYYGQVSFVLLLATTLLALAIRDGESLTGSFRVGAALALSSIKPHLFVVLYLFVIIRSFARSEFRTLVSMSALILAFLSSVWFFQPEILSWYLEASAQPPIHWKSSSLGTFVQPLFSEAPLFGRLLPSLVLCASLFVFFLVRRGDVSPQLTLAVIVPLSVAASPYGWMYDFIALVPTVLFSISLLLNREYGSGIPLGALALMLCNVGLLLGPRGIGLEWGFWYPFAIAAIGYAAVNDSSGANSAGLREKEC